MSLRSVKLPATKTTVSAKPPFRDDNSDICQFEIAEIFANTPSSAWQTWQKQMANAIKNAAATANRIIALSRK